MAKRGKCEHGNTLFKIEGCATCVDRAIRANGVVRTLNIDPDDLMALVAWKWITREAIQKDLPEARRVWDEQVAKREMGTRSGDGKR
jgi:hypothetical protein